MKKEMKKEIQETCTKKTRDSSIELLRIVSMLMIIIHHLVYHTKIFMIPGENKFISLVMLSGGKIAVIIYILIMGYYSGKSKFNIAKPINIILKVIIYSILFMIILKSGNILDIKEYEQYWFINTWLGLYMLESLIKICEREIPDKIKKIIFMYITILFIIPVIRKNNIQAFVYFYLCGKHILPKFVKMFNKQLLNVCAISALYLFIIAFNLEMEQNTIFPLITAMFVFAIFANINIKNNLINKIAKYTMGVYLIHDNTNVREEIIIKRLNMLSIYQSKYFLISTLSISLIIFVVCIIIDYLISLIIEKTVFKSKKINDGILKINTYFNNFINNERNKNEDIQKRYSKKSFNSTNNIVNI